MNILRSFTETVVTTPTDTFPISFEYDEKYDAVHVFLNDVAVEDLGYTVSQVNAVTLKVEPAIPEGTVRIERETDIDKMKYIFDAGALFIDQNVDADFRQIVHSQQEVRDGFIKLRGDVLPLVHGLQEALQQAQEASEAAQEAANAAEVAAAQTQYYLRYFNPEIVYPKNARIMLDNGDIVKNTLPNNTTNPNSDMTGWVKVNSASQIVESSGLTQQQFNDVITNKEIYLSRLGAKFDGSDETAILQRAVDMADELTTIVFDKTGFKFSSVNYGTKSVSMRGVFTNNPRRIPIVVYITGAGIVGSGQVIRLDSLDFRSTGNKNDGANITLMDNPHANGTFLSVTNCAARNFSGVVFGFKDLIDSKISGFIPERNNLVFKFTLGAWVASTTITLEKIYAQQNTLLFDADDCDHCTMIDCIFEYNTSLGHINSGSWTIINYYGEGNSAPLVATNTSLTILKAYTLNGPNDGFLNTFTTNDPYSVGSTLVSGRQLSAFDFRKEYETYRRINPTFGGDTWTKIGNMRLETAGSCVITIIGADAYHSTSGAVTDANSRSVIICHKRSGGNGVPAITATWHTVGNGAPIADVRIVDTKTIAGLEVYVLQKAYGYMGVAVDVAKAELFTYDIKTSQQKPTGGGSGDENTPTMLIVPKYVKLAAGTGYVGSDGTNPLLGGSTATTIGAAGSAAALPTNPLGYIIVSINGTPRKIPYYNI